MVNHAKANNVFFVLLMFSAIFSSNVLNAAVFTATNNLNSTVNYEISLNSDTNEATITASGPDNSWFAIGFGNTVMNGTYTIFFNSTEGVAVERKLASRGPGTILAPSISVIDDSTSGGIRSITVKRPLTGPTNDYYSFNAIERSVDAIIAMLPGSKSLQYHGAPNRTPTSLDFAEMIQRTTVPFPLWGLIAIAGLIAAVGFARRTRR